MEKLPQAFTVWAPTQEEPSKTIVNKKSLINIHKSREVFMSINFRRHFNQAKESIGKHNKEREEKN